MARMASSRLFQRRGAALENAFSPCVRRMYVTSQNLLVSHVSFVQSQSIVGYPPTKTLSSEEEDLVWKFRKYLSGQKKVSHDSTSS